MRLRSATSSRQTTELSRNDRRRVTRSSLRTGIGPAKSGAFKQAVKMYLEGMTKSVKSSSYGLEQLGMSRVQLNRAKAVAARIASGSAPWGVRPQLNGLYIGAGASISRSRALRPTQVSDTEASTMMASSPAPISPAKIAEFISQFDISHDPAWRVFSRGLERAEIFAVECLPYAVATKADGSFHGRANLQVNAVDRGLQKTKISVSYDVPVEVRGHVNGDQVVVDALAFD